MLNSTIEVTTMIGCPLMCTFCPQDTLRNGYGKDEKYMSLDTFKSIVDQLPEQYRIDFSGMAEAWANPDASSMFKYALEKGRRVAVFTTLYNWSRDDVNTVIELLAEYSSQVETFCVHFPDRNGNMKGWKYNEDWEYALHALSATCNHFGIKFESMTMDGNGLVHEALDHLNIRLWNWQGHDRAGTLPLDQIKGQTIQIAPRHTGPIRCGKTPRYDQNVILPNGDVVLCCMDYERKHILGNLKESTIDEIRKQDTFKRILMINAQDQFSTESLCRTCTDAIPQQR
jgi:radical SAM protein with 4Fe4S-binding SPASM domain